MGLNLFGSRAKSQEAQEVVSAEDRQMHDDFEAVKSRPGQITGYDFDRAFDFIENYPGSELSELLLNQMYSTTSQSLKGLTYESAIKVLEKMPDHAGADSIVQGMYKLEEDYISELSSGVISYILDIIPDHPLGSQLTTALAKKNIAVAYEFIENHPDNIYTESVIRAMFQCNPNLALLLLQEKLDHPKVGTIFDGIYALEDDKDIVKFTSNAIIFILEVAPDHPKLDLLLQTFAKNNYVKAYAFAQNNPTFPSLHVLLEYIFEQQPSLRDVVTT